MAEALGIERGRCEIQSPSGTGLRTALDGRWFRAWLPVEDVRGGMALGELREEDDMAVFARGEVLLWNILTGGGVRGFIEEMEQAAVNRKADFSRSSGQY